MSWLTFESFAALYPGTGVSEETFPAYAAAAEMAINEATYWRAQTACDAASLAALSTCEAQLIKLAEDAGTDNAVQSSLSGVTGVSNHGYSESYASAADTLAAAERQRRQIIHAALSGPATRWMLYAGGVYHPRNRNRT